MVDHRRPNVVAVLSYCCSVPCVKVEVWKEKIENKKKVVQDVIYNSLKVNAPVIVVENDFEAHGLEKDGDFTKLPNGELQPKNLKWVRQSAGKDEFVHPYIKWLCKLELPWMDGELVLPLVS